MAKAAPRESEVDSGDDIYAITSRADDFVHGRQTYVFTYTLENVVRHFDDTDSDEFYWDVNGTQWSQPFGRVSARVTMPDDLATALTGATGVLRGSAGRDRHLRHRNRMPRPSLRPRRIVQPFQTMTVAIGFDSGTFTPFDPSYFASPWGWLQAVFGGRARRGVRLRGNRARVANSETRPGVRRSSPSTRRRARSMRSRARCCSGSRRRRSRPRCSSRRSAAASGSSKASRKFFGGTKLKAVLVDPSKADGDGRMLLDGLFASGVPGEEFEFGRSDTRFSSAAQTILKWANRELVSQGLRRKVSAGTRALPDPDRRAASAAGVIVFGFAALDNAVDPRRADLAHHRARSSSSSRSSR